MNQHLETKLQQIADENAYGAEIQHAMRLAAEAAMEWEPMESAPNEIEVRVLLCNGFSVVTGYWDGKGWVNERSKRRIYYPAIRWMPLPKPPKVKP